jgi:error-prone DNA polymerase
VTVSDWDCTLEEEPASSGGFALRLGLRQIAGIGEDAAKAVVRARAEAPFESIGELARRADLKKNELEALAEAGALEALTPGRRVAMWRARAPRLGGLFESIDLERDAEDPNLPEVGKMEQLLLDYGRLGLSVDDHPMKHVRPHLEDRQVKRAAELAKLRHGSRVRVAGLIIGRQRPMTASGVTFVSLEDETGVANLVVTVPVFEKFRHPLLHGKLVLVAGSLEREGQVIHVLVRRVVRLELPSGAAIRARSRDFH